MGFTDANGIVLHFRFAGPPGASPLVLVNSLGTDARIWDRVIERLGHRFRILSYDKRGHGLSDAPTGPYRLDDHVRDVESLLDRFGICEFALAGVSVGGMIGQALAARHPARVKALVLCDSAARIGTDEYWNERIAAVRSGGMGAIADAVIARWFSPGFRATQAAELAGWRNMLLRADVEGYAGTCAAIRDADLRLEAARIRTPTLVLAGEHDLATPSDLVRATADLIPGAHFDLIAGTGHIPFIERPAHLADTIGSFLEKAGYA